MYVVQNKICFFLFNKQYETWYGTKYFEKFKLRLHSRK